MFRNIFLLCALSFFVIGLVIFYKFNFPKTNNLVGDAKLCISFWENEDETCNESSYLLQGESSIPENFNIEGELCNKNQNLDKFKSFKQNENLHGIFSNLKISSDEIHALGLALKPHVLGKSIRPGDLYFFEIDELSKNFKIKKFILIKEDPNRVPITYEVNLNDKNKFVVKKNFPEVKKKLGFYPLVVKKTLFATFMELPYGNELMQRFMNVFSWQIKMPAEVNQSDVIEILVEKKYVNDVFIGYGKIKNAKYLKPNKTLQAFYFESGDEKVKGVFDINGKTLEKEFLLSPVYETTATSHQKWRLHPVRKIRIRHNGVDYRGSIGTPFFAIADGKVIEKGYDKNVGHMIRIAHKYGVYSESFHADKIESSLNVGSKVKRGQIIGYIGDTGRLCTGPHLHLGLYKMQGEKKKFIDLISLKNILKDAKSLSGDYLTEFNREKDIFLSIIDNEKGQKKLANN